MSNSLTEDTGHWRPSTVANMSAIQSKDVEGDVKNLNAKLANPLAGFTPAELATKAEDYCRSHEIKDEEDIRAFRLGAVIAQVRI